MLGSALKRHGCCNQAITLIIWVKANVSGRYADARRAFACCGGVKCGRRRSAVESSQDSSDSSRKFLRGRNQTQHQIAIVLEIVEMSGMYENVFSAQKINGQIFISLNYWDAEDGVPAAFEGKALARFLCGELAVELS